MGKKLKTTLALLMALFVNTSVFADKEDQFYLKVFTGTNFVNKIKENPASAQDSGKAPIFGMAGGYYLTDSIRSEVAVDYSKLDFKGKERVKVPGEMNFNLKRLYITSAMLNGYVDLFNRNDVALFATAGLGIAQINEQVSWVLPFNGKELRGSKPKKTIHNFVYSLGAGGSIKFTDNLYFEAAYSFKDFGKTNRESMEVGNERGTKKNLRRHDITLGIRMDV